MSGESGLGRRDGLGIAVGRGWSSEIGCFGESPVWAGWTVLGPDAEIDEGCSCATSPRTVFTGSWSTLRFARDLPGGRAIVRSTTRRGELARWAARGDRPARPAAGRRAPRHQRGRGRAGEAGVGKSALLDYVLGHAAGCRVVRSSGVESEMELPFAGLHQLCAPFLDHLERLPRPQRDALATAFGLRPGAPPDRFIVGLAVLTLLADIAEAQPLICLVDDGQWLDRASAQVLGFVARRLAAESVVIVFALREPADIPDFASLQSSPWNPSRSRTHGPFSLRDHRPRRRAGSRADPRGGSRQPARAARAAARLDTGRIRRRFRPAGWRLGFGQGRGELQAAPEPAPSTTPGACSWWRPPSRSVTRPSSLRLPRSSASRRRRPSLRRRRPARDQDAGSLPPSSRPLRRVQGSVGRRPPSGPRCACRGDGPGPGSGSPGLAPRRCCAGPDEDGRA